MMHVEMVEQEAGVRADFLGPSSPPLCYCAAFPPLRIQSTEGMACPSGDMAHDGLRKNAKDTTNPPPLAECSEEPEKSQVGWEQ